jgi:hypothetical protein
MFYNSNLRQECISWSLINMFCHLHSLPVTVAVLVARLKPLTFRFRGKCWTTVLATPANCMITCRMYFYSWDWIRTTNLRICGRVLYLCATIAGQLVELWKVLHWDQQHPCSQILDLDKNLGHHGTNNHGKKIYILGHSSSAKERMLIKGGKAFKSYFSTPSHIFLSQECFGIIRERIIWWMIQSFNVYGMKFIP